MTPAATGSQTPEPGSLCRVLVVGPSWVGDMVMAQSLFMRLLEQEPRTLIDVLAPAWSLALLDRMPEVHEGIVMPVGHGRLGLRERYRIGRQLRDRQYQRAFLLPNSLKSALIPWWARIPERTGYRGEQRYGLVNDMRRLDRAALTMTVQRFVALAESRDADVPPVFSRPCLRPGDIDSALRQSGLQKPDGPLLVLCPGAEFGPAKRWPAEYYADIATRWLQTGHSVWLLGSDRDRPVGQVIAQAVGDGCHDLTGKTRLGEAVDLMSLADVVVSNDSGLMHVAAALDRKLVAIYGSSDPGFTPPLNPDARIVSLGLDCSPCFQRECPLSHLDCLRKLTPDRVQQEIDVLGQADG